MMHIEEHGRITCMVEGDHAGEPVIVVKQPDKDKLEAHLSIAATTHARHMGYASYYEEARLVSYSTMDVQRRNDGRMAPPQQQHAHMVLSASAYTDYKIQYRVKRENDLREYTANVSLDRALIL